MTRIRQAIRAFWRLMGGHPRLSAGCGAVAVGVAVSLSAMLASSAAPVKPPPMMLLLPPSMPSPLPVVHHATGLYSPFTGEPVNGLRPVLAVKIDNIVQARPQTGLQSADLMYVIPVEGGLTRFMAVYSSHVPPVIGPVRSARQSDLDILRQFGRPAFAWSGATPHLVPFIERAPLVDLYALLVGGYYRVGFRFGPLPAGGRVVRSWTVQYPAATITFRWSGKAKRWLVWMDGAPGRAAEGGQLGGRTVIIQYTRIATSRFEEYGGRPPYAISVGSGTAIILRDGRAYQVHWSWPTLNSGTTFTLPDGKRMLFARGQVWIVYAPDNHASYRNAGAV